eukprot:3840345-Alexandrium_andersonii.AAC.1
MVAFNKDLTLSDATLSPTSFSTLSPFSGLVRTSWASLSGHPFLGIEVGTPYFPLTRVPLPWNSRSFKMQFLAWRLTALSWAL